MGYMRHHAIIGTSFDVELLNQAHDKAAELGMSVTPIIGGATNGYYTFLVGPDGSKEGWRESDRGDAQRADFVLWLDAQRHKDDSSNLDWAEVQYGDDDADNRVVRDDAEHYRQRWANVP
jgi:hypothetical protein